ncbi:MAG: hypothetical protein LC792_27485 [Actinobacteria bacterium]|nr:hypothetical protein [Actinomycetota bacterium]
MDQINLVHAKGGQGTSVTACAVALQAARDGRHVRLDGHDRAELAAILGMVGDGPVVPGLTVGPADYQPCDLIVHDGAADTGTDLLVIRPCYLALRAALTIGLCGTASAAVLISEAGRALDGGDVATITGLPVIATIPVRADIARAVDAGVLTGRLPEALVTAAGRILAYALTGTGKEVA